jgi:hypothetical protein
MGACGTILVWTNIYASNISKYSFCHLSEEKNPSSEHISSLLFQGIIILMCLYKLFPVDDFIIMYQIIYSKKGNIIRYSNFQAEI